MHGAQDKSRRVKRWVRYNRFAMKNATGDMQKKNPAAQALGRLRAAQMTFEERSEAGKAGGAARAAKMTKAERKASAKKAAAARWAKKAKEPK
jgi:hypothetical protein